MSTANILDLADEVLDQIVSHSRALEAINDRFVPIDGPTNLFIKLPRKAGLVSLASTCTRLRRLSLPALFCEVYLSRDLGKEKLLEAWETRKPETSPALLDAIRKFYVYTQIHNCDAFALIVVDMINTFTHLDTFAFKGIAFLGVTTQLKVLQAISQHPSLSLAKVMLGRIDKENLSALSAPSMDLRRVRAMCVSCPPDAMQPLLRAGLQIDCLYLNELHVLNSWLQYQGTTTIYSLDFDGMDGAGEGIEHLILKYLDTIKKVTITGEKNAKNVPAIRNCIDGFHFTADVQLLSLTCVKAADKTFSSCSNLVIISSQSRQHLVASGAFSRLCSRLHSTFPDLKSLRFRSGDEGPLGNKQYLENAIENVVAAYNTFSTLRLLIISVDCDGADPRLHEMIAEPTERYISDNNGKEITMSLSTPGHGAVFSVAMRDRRKPAGLRYYNMTSD